MKNVLALQKLKTPIRLPSNAAQSCTSSGGNCCNTKQR